MTGVGGTPRRRDASILVATLAGALLVHLNAFRAGFLTFDDPDNVLDNYAIRAFSRANLEHIVSTPLQFMYTPVVTLSYALDYQIGGLHAWIYHTTNLALHLVNIVLVYRLCRALTRRATAVWVATVAFAIHPINVDTVAWISTRSTLLATAFSLATLLAYLRYRRTGGTGALVAAVPLFGLAVLAKSTAVAIAPTLVLLDLCRGRRFGVRMVLEKLPFFAIALAAGLVGLHFRMDQVAPYPYTILDRAVVVCSALVAYLVKLVVPWPLPFAYAYPPKNGAFLPWYLYLTPLALAAVTWALYRAGVPRRLLFFGLGFFVLNIVLSQSVLLEDNYQANRYAYLPAVGLFLIAGHLVAGLRDRLRRSRVDRTGTGRASHDRARPRRSRIDLTGLAAGGLTLVTVTFAVLAFGRGLLWVHPVDVLDDAIAHQPRVPFLYNSRGMAEYDAREYDAARADFSRAFALDPRFTLGYYYLGVIASDSGDYRGAISQFDTAIRLSGRFGYAYAERGKAEAALGDDASAIADFTQAIAWDGYYVDAYVNRALARFRSGDPAGACADWRSALALGYQDAASSLAAHCPTGN